MPTIPELFDEALRHHQSGQLALAENLYCRVLQANPSHARAWHLLGLLAGQAARQDLAVEYIGHALRLMPDFAEAHSDYGIVLCNQGKLDEAEAAFREALRLKPDYAEAHSNLGIVRRVKGHLLDAEICYREALRLKPCYAEAHYNLGNVLLDQDKLTEVEACYRQAIHLKPGYAEAHNNLANVLCEQGKLDEAEAYSRQALRLRPRYAEAHNSLGVILGQLGRLDEAEQNLREALHHNPRLADAWFQLSCLLRGRLPDADVEAMRRLHGDPGLAPDKRSALYYGLAQALDARQEFEEAGALLGQANSLALDHWRRLGQVYDPALHSQFVDRLLAAFSPAFFERVRGLGTDSERPIFIVGLPRSGTTLTEQILASHSQVFGAGELDLVRDSFLRLAGSAGDHGRALDNLPRLDGPTIRDLADWQLRQLQSLNAAAPYVVDKMPANCLYLGFLAALFPRAKYIHCRRNFRDVAVSCWMTNFRCLRWTNDLEHIAAQFRDYDRVMNHWRQVLPVPVLDVKYEETVADTERAARRLVSWCGLKWEPACLKYHEGKRPVRSASAMQVRQPIFRHSVGRWRHYEKALGPLFAMLPVESD